MSGPIERKPSLVEYLVDYIFEVGGANNWTNLDLGEVLACDFAEQARDYSLTDAEEVMLAGVLERYIEEQLGDAIDQKIAEQVESAKEWRDAKDSAINSE